ncbi:Diacylglycerol kinase beta [Sarcoptes scabiei]|nr:Diacylglycerol kinase beta [Sarcoptes scabiei]
MQHDSKSAIRVCCFSPSSALLASGADDGSLVVWDISTRRKIKTSNQDYSKITGCSFSPDSSYLISCSSSGNLKLWSTKYGNVHYLMSYEFAHDLGVLGCDFSSQYEVNVAEGPLQSYYLLATCGNDDLVKLWHVIGGTKCSIRLSHKLVGHEGYVSCCKFSLDGSLLSSASGDKTIIVWDPRSGVLLHRLEGHKRYVTSCAFSDNNQLLASGSNDQTIIVWHLDKIKQKEVHIELLEDNSDAKSFRDHFGEESSKSQNDQQDENHCPATKNESFRKKFPNKWNEQDVQDWLHSIGLEQYSERFRADRIDGNELLSLSNHHLLENLKIEPLGHRNKILRGIKILKNPFWNQTNEIDKIEKPTEFCCPITKDLMIDPVIAADGHSYENAAMEKWIANGNATSPMTNDVLSHKMLIPNHNLRSLIEKFQAISLIDRQTHS